MEKKLSIVPSEILLSSFNFIISIYFTLEPKLSEFYSGGVNAFCLCRTCVGRRQYMRVRRSLIKSYLIYSNLIEFKFKSKLTLTRERKCPISFHEMTPEKIISINISSVIQRSRVNNNMIGTR